MAQSWQQPVAGFRYETKTIAIEAAFQAEKLAACGLDAAALGDVADPSFFIAEAIRAGIDSGISAEGNVNMVQSLRQHRPARLGEPLTVSGEIVAVTDVPRGLAIDTAVRFLSAADEPVITANRRSLKPDPARAKARGAGDRPPPVVEDPARLRVVAEHALTPERVVAYSREGNSIHYDPAAAERAGFRAPLIGGGMGVHYLFAWLWSEHAPQRLDLDIYFRRPIFWDDDFVVAVDDGPGAICLARGGKVLTEARINALG